MTKRFLGSQYPLTRGARGFMAQSNGTDQIKADLLQLLLTNPGERVMLPQYGTALRDLLFDPNDASLAFRAKQMIMDAIVTWEPRIEIANINVTIGSNSLNPSDTEEEFGSILGISIEFIDPQNIAEVQSLVLQIPVGV